MNVTQNIIYYPPVTSNKLDASQRVRLMRSTRKLGAILGTTPRLADPEPIPILLPIGRSSTSSFSSNGHGYGLNYGYPSSYPSTTTSQGGSLYAAPSVNSSVASIALPSPQSSTDALPMPRSFSSKPHRSKDAPHPLVLRFNTVSVDAGDVRVLMSPLTASVVPECLTPATPSAPSEAEMRRKKMAKLNRTFGENVPPEIVFPSTAPTPRGGKQPPRVQPAPREVFITPPPRRSSRVWMTGSNAGAWTGEWNRKDIGEVQQKLRMLKAR